MSRKESFHGIEVLKYIIYKYKKIQQETKILASLF